jgi:PAS domain S-box-containing protein
MGSPVRLDVSGYSELQVIWSEREHALLKGFTANAEPAQPVLIVAPTSNPPSPLYRSRVTNEYSLKDRLGADWAATPIELNFQDGRDIVVLVDPGGELLTQVPRPSADIGGFLRAATAIGAAVAEMHKAGLIHRDIKPANILFDEKSGQAWLTGFGIALPAPQGAQAPAPPDLIAGSLAYMSPEQTGRIIQPVDMRSDLYSVGVTLYEMLTGTPPFLDSDPHRLIHAHAARRPPHPTEKAPGIPEVVSSVVLKLLAKNVGERYQSATGLLADLRHCLDEWTKRGQIEPFPLGSQDGHAQLHPCRELHGRSRELERLNAVWDRVRIGGNSEVVLVSGPSGVGKSAFVERLRLNATASGGLFAAGKFDQYSRDIPFAPLAQAFASLVRRLIGADEAELSQWTANLTGALAANGQVIVNLVPQLSQVIGDQAPVPDVSGPESKKRLLETVRQFLSVFAQPGRPLVLFLDDLQWLDTATLEVFEYLATQADLKHLLLVGAYRQNEITPDHPLAHCLQALRETKVRMQEFPLGTIEESAVANLVGEVLGESPDRVEPLAEVVFEKTGGNPFFTRQFLTQLLDDELLIYDTTGKAWNWAPERIRTRQISDNVVDLMTDRLLRLQPASLRALQHLACLGNRSDFFTLCRALDTSSAAVETLLNEPVRNGLVVISEDTYAFSHDRIQEAAYALLHAIERSKMHGIIGLRLAKKLSDAELDAQIFDVASQLSRSDVADPSFEKRAQISSINLRAARKARASAAYTSALAYLADARRLLGEDAWATKYRLIFSIALEEAECSFLNGDLEKTAALIDSTLRLAADEVDKAAIYRLKIEFHVVKSQNDEAVQTGLTALRLFGIDFSPHPDIAAVQQEYDSIRELLGSRAIDCLVEQPPMVDPRMLSVMRLLAEIWPPANFTDFNLTAMAICRMVNITLTHGLTSASRQGIALLGWLMGPVFANYEDGYRLVLLALQLASREGSPVDVARTTDTVALTASWSQPLPVAIDWWRKAHRRGVEAGDRYFACYSCAHAALQLFISGRPLSEIESECLGYLEFARSISFPDGMDLVLSTTRAIASLRGRTQKLDDLNGNDFDQNAFEARLSGNRVHVVVSWYWTRKTMLQFLAGNYEAALDSADKVPPGPYIKIVLLQQLDYHYFTALALAASIDSAPRESAAFMRERLLGHHKQIATWAEQTGSATFADKRALIAAEIARLEGRVLDAESLYEESIQLAHRNGFVQHEGVALEVAARFYRGRGLFTIATAYLRAGRDCFLRWGAIAKVHQLEAHFPEIVQNDFGNRDDASGTTNTTVLPIERLDVATIIKISQAISSEIILERLIDRLMRLAIEHAGARRAVLLLVRGGEATSAAEAKVAGQAIAVDISENSQAASALPQSLIRYVIRSRETVLVSDASRENEFSSDPYLSQHGARSIVGIPMMNRGQAIGVLYLENDLVANAFNAGRLAVLNFLASQAAISLENSQLYKEVAEREGQVRRLVDSNVIGVVIWDLDGRLIDANDAFLRMVQYDRADLEAGLRWFDMTPPDWQEVHATAELEELQTTGLMQAREKEFYRKDGSRVPVLIGAASFEHKPTQGVAYILDLTDLKRAEADAKESERRYRQVHAELAHANRLTTMGQMAGSIVHEVTQPIAATRINAATALRKLRRQDPDLDAVESALDKITSDLKRARDVIDRFREMIKKTTPKMDVQDINVPVRQVLELVSTEAAKAGVVLRADLANELPPIRGDRVQLQQVMLNLILNAIEAVSTVYDGPRAVVIRTAPSDSGGVLVVVSDTGPGLDAKSKGRLFETFFTTKSNGMGLGLSICRSIIEAHLGRLWVEENEPHGAVFQFSLPPGTDAGEDA